jgi:hypothetical protein
MADIQMQLTPGGLLYAVPAGYTSPGSASITPPLRIEGASTAETILNRLDRYLELGLATKLQIDAMKEQAKQAIRQGREQQYLDRMQQMERQGSFPWAPVGMGLGALAVGGLLLYFIFKRK